jgi:hypothetical protein
VPPTNPKLIRATTNGAAMTLTNASPSAKGRRAKFTPQAIEKIKEFLAGGATRDEIAHALGVTVGSLQVTCSRLGISLRRNCNGSARHARDSSGRSIPTAGWVCIAHVRERKTEDIPQKAAETEPLAKFTIVMRNRGKEVSSDVPLTLHAIGELGCIASLHGLNMAELVGQILAQALRKDLIHEMLRDEVSSSAT